MTDTITPGKITTIARRSDRLPGVYAVRCARCHTVQRITGTCHRDAFTILRDAGWSTRKNLWVCKTCTYQLSGISG